MRKFKILDSFEGWKVGDEVKIHKPGHQYTTYKDLFHFLGFQDENYAIREEYNIRSYNAKKDEIGIIKTIVEDQHQNYNNTIIKRKIFHIISENGREYAIGIGGFHKTLKDFERIGFKARGDNGIFYDFKWTEDNVFLVALDGFHWVEQDPSEYEILEIFYGISKGL